MNGDKDQDLLPLGNTDLPFRSGSQFIAKIPQTVSALQLRSRSGTAQSDIPYGLPVTNVADLAALFKKHRASYHWSQSYVARRAGVGRRFVSEFENGKTTVRLDEALKVLAACGLVLTGQPQAPLFQNASRD